MITVSSNYIYFQNGSMISSSLNNSISLNSCSLVNTDELHILGFTFNNTTNSRYITTANNQVEFSNVNLTGLSSINNSFNVDMAVAQIVNTNVFEDTLSSGFFSKINFSNIQLNIGNNVNMTNSQITVNRTGIHEVIYTICVKSVNSGDGDKGVLHIEPRYGGIAQNIGNVTDVIYEEKNNTVYTSVHKTFLVDFNSKTTALEFSLEFFAMYNGNVTNVSFHNPSTCIVITKKS